LFTILFATSCTQEGELEKSRYLFNEYSVDRSEIEAIASGIKFPMDESSNLKSTGDQTKNICSIDEMKNSIGETSFYIVNYDVVKDQFGYSNAITDDYDYNTVESNIDNDRPVILSGFDATEGGHSWVCDGYRQSNYYYEDCSMVSLLHFHMVWGAGITNVGWYVYNNFNPGNLSYNNDKSMIYNIIP